METLPIGAAFEPAAGQRSLLDKSRLDAQDFLQVMVAQMRNQNPLEPQSDADFISGIAQFDQLSSLNEINESLSAMASLSALGQVSSLLGREVLADSGTDEPIQGVVHAVEIDNGTPILVVGEHRVPASAVQAVR